MRGSIYFCNNSTCHPQFLGYFFIYIHILLSSCSMEKAFLELTFAEIVTPENSHLCWRMASSACSRMSVVPQAPRWPGVRMGAVSQGFTYKILLRI